MSAYLRRNEPVAGVVNNVNIGTVTGDGKVFWANRDVTQTVNTTTGVAGDELVSLVRAIRQALPVLELDQADADRVRSQLDVLEGELGTDQPDEGVVRSVLQRALGKLGDVTGNSLGLLLTAYGRHLMQQAGILPE